MKNNKIVTKLVFQMLLALVVMLPLSGRAGWQMVWSDEFDQPDGSAPDSSKWGYDTGGGGWGNSELENYTTRTNNARIENGQLVIEAIKENYGGSSYTSARLLTRNKWSWAYGRMEARIKIPRGQGIWPAFWMLGDNIGSVGWPTCGEIDIMENIGKEPTLVHGTIHGPGYSGANGIGGPCSLTNNAAFADDYHVYAVEWTTNQIKWFVDDQQYFTVTPASLPAGKTWVFTQPQFILLNVAVGGQWPGNPDGTTFFPQQMLVDYVRVYTYSATAPGPVPVGIQRGGQVSWPTTNNTTWILQSANAPGQDVVWNTLLGPTSGDVTTNTFFDPNWPSQNYQYQILQTTYGAGNIITNGGFEAGNGSVADSWSISGSQPPVRTGTDTHGGQFSMWLSVTNPATTANNSQIDQNVASQGGSAVVPGQVYNFSFWARQLSSGVSLVQNYKVAWLNSSGGNISDTGWIGFTGGNSQWTQINRTNLVAPASAVNAKITLYATTGTVANGHGDVLIDEVSLAYAEPGETNLIPATVQSAVQITWPGNLGSHYDVEYASEINGATWSNLISSVDGNGATNAVYDLYSTNDSRFYRVRLLP